MEALIPSYTYCHDLEFMGLKSLEFLQSNAHWTFQPQFNMIGTGYFSNSSLYTLYSSPRLSEVSLSMVSAIHSEPRSVIIKWENTEINNL